MPLLSFFHEMFQQMRESVGFRLGQWLRRPTRHKLESVQFHLLRQVEKGAELLMRVAEHMNSETLRRARFEALALRSDVALADRTEKYLVFTSDKNISKTVFVTGSFEFEKLELALHLLGDKFALETLVDVGANIGTICIPAVSRGLARRAIAIEPEPNNFRLLEINVRLNDLSDRITLHNVALGPTAGQVLQMELSMDNSGDHRIRVATDDGSYDEAARRVIDVRSETLDAVVGSLSGTSTLAWMDTQGYEGQVLLGAQKLVAARIPLVLEFWPYGMNRTRSYAGLRAAAMCYESYYDLSDPGNALRPTSDLDALFATLDRTGGYTDILLI